MSTSKIQKADSRWGWLYKIGGAAALFSVVIIPIQLIIFIVWGRSNIFGGATAYTGIVAAILNWGPLRAGGTRTDPRHPFRGPVLGDMVDPRCPEALSARARRLDYP